MKTRMVELILVLIAAALFSWGLVRAVKRGDSAARSWTTYSMSGLVVLAASNVAIRSRKLAVAVLAVSAFFLLLALAAALLARADSAPHPLPAIMRSMVFLVFLGLTGWIQTRPPRPPVDTRQQDAASNGDPAVRLGDSGATEVRHR